MTYPLLAEILKPDHYYEIYFDTGSVYDCLVVEQSNGYKHFVINGAYTPGYDNWVRLTDSKYYEFTGVVEVIDHGLKQE